MKRALSLFAALAVIGFLAWAFIPRPVGIEVVEVAPRSITVSVEEQGEARIREVFTVSATIAGKLRRIDLHAGDEVVANETVVALIGPAAPALLDARSRAVAEASVAAARSAVDLAKAQVSQAQAARDFASVEAERSQELHDRGAIPTRVLDTAILDRKTAEAALESARANLSVRERELASAEAVLAGGSLEAGEDCCVRTVSPVSGRVLRVLTESEQVVPAGAPILEVGDPQDLEVVVEVLSSDAVRIAEGAQATVAGWGGPPIPARVERVEPSARTKVSALGIDEQRVEVILALEGDPAAWGQLGHGFQVNARITVWSGQDVLSVPVGALFRDGSDWAVYAVQDGRARLRKITVGHTDDTLAEVVSGLAQGDRVILHPSDQITDGVRVAAMAG